MDSTKDWAGVEVGQRENSVAPHAGGELFPQIRPLENRNARTLRGGSLAVNHWLKKEFLTAVTVLLLRATCTVRRSTCCQHHDPVTTRRPDSEHRRIFPLKFKLRLSLLLDLESKVASHNVRGRETVSSRQKCCNVTVIKM